MNFDVSSACRIALGSGLAMCALSASAQAASPAEEARPATELPTIRITGRKMGELIAPDAAAGVLGDLPLVEMPFSVNVITRELLDKQQAAFLGDFLKNDPSAAVGNVPVPFLMLRGFSVGSDGMLYDGLPGHGGLTDGRAGMQFVDRVEVLKGASAFLFGAGAASSLGGSINHLPKRPIETPVRSIGLGFANRSLWSAEADLGDRLGAGRELGYRVNLGVRDGTTAVSRYGWGQQVGALALDWRARPGLVFTFGAESVSNHLPELQPFYLLSPGLAVPKAPEASRNVALSWDDFKTRATSLYLRADWDLAPDWSVTAQALHSHSARPALPQARFGFIVSEAGDTLMFGGMSGSKNASENAQVLLRGKWVSGAVVQRLTWGVTGSHDQSRSGSSSFVGPGPGGSFPTNLYDPIDYAAPVFTAIDLPLTSKARGRSILISDFIDLGTQWSVLLGARRATVGVDNFDTVTGAVATSNEATKTLPTAALMWKPQAGALVYLNYSEGLEPGGSVSPTNDAQFLPPRSTRQLELGGKLDMRDMVITAALFDMKRPQEIFDPLVGENVQRGSQRHRGLELVVNGRLTPELQVASGIMWLDTRLGGTGDATADGKRAVGVPRLSANIWAEYRVAALPGLSINGGVFHASAQYLDGANTQAISGWTRIDIGANYDTRIGNLPTTLLLNVDNLTDRSYWASAQSGILTLADPRTIKLGARFSF